MYYYETLNSADYRGSMTSLQSCQSGFSTISKVSKICNDKWGTLLVDIKLIFGLLGP